MFTCHRCSKSTSMETNTCPYCGAVSAASAHDHTETTMEPDAQIITGNQAARWNMPFGAGATLGEAFNLWSNTLGKLVVLNMIPLVPIIALIVAGVVMVISSLAHLFAGGLEGISVPAITTAVSGLGTGTLLLLFVVMVGITFFYIPAYAGQFRLLAEREQYGKTNTSIFSAYLGGFRYILPLLGLFLLVYLAVVATITPTAFLIPISPALCGVVILTLLIFWSIALTRLVLVVPIMVIEQKTLFTAISQSNQLVKGNTRTTMAILALFFLLMLGFGLVLGLLGLIPLLGQLISLAAQILLTPLQAALLVAIYGGLKTRADQ